MEKTIILYKSSTNFSARYAAWLAAALDCRAIPLQERNYISLDDYSAILLTGGLYAGQMAGLSWLKKQLPSLEGKRIAAVAVGCAPMENPDLEDNMRKLFGGTPQIKGFYCQGGLDYEHMKPVHKIMMAGLRAALRNKPEMAEMLAVISHSFDGAKKEYLAPVIAWARGESLS